MNATALPLFYNDPQPLQAKRHGGYSLNVSGGYHFAAQANSVPLVSGELPTACRSFPIVFAEGERPMPVAVLGLRGRQNVFVDSQGQWRPDAYVPAYIRRYPFIFLENEDASQYTLCLDMAADRVVQGHENPLFDEAGEPTALTRDALEFSRQYQNQYAETVRFGEALAEADVLIEKQAEISLLDGQRFTLSGFNMIDEAKFNALPEKTFLLWRQNGWLPLIYSHLISIAAWPSLLGYLSPDGERHRGESTEKGKQQRETAETDESAAGGISDPRPVD